MPDSEATQQKPKGSRLERYRDVLLVILGSAIGFIGTCTGQWTQVYLQRTQLETARETREQDLATIAFEEATRLSNAVLFAEERSWSAARGVQGAGTFDSAMAQLESSAASWQLNLPRTRALMSVHFGDIADEYFRMHGELLDAYLSLAHKLQLKRAERTTVYITQKQSARLPPSERLRLEQKHSAAAELDSAIAAQFQDQREFAMKYQRRFAEMLLGGQVGSRAPHK
jgi:hypothetical protein